MSKLETNPKSKARNSSFGFVSNFGFRVSGFLLAVAPLLSIASSLQPLSLSGVHWTHGFWADRLEVCRTQTVPALWRIMEGTNYSQYFQNFRIAAGLTDGRHRGAPFNDGDFYKWLEAASATLAVTNDPNLARLIDSCIDVIAKAQRSDGYIHTPILIANNIDLGARPSSGAASTDYGHVPALTKPTEAAAPEDGPAPRAASTPFQNPLDFEMYNMGHLMSAGCVHYRATSQTNFIAVARHTPNWDDHLYREFQPAALQPINLRFIPYFAWANRGPSEMTVWLPLSP